MKAIYIAPIGSVEQKILDVLKVCIWQIFGFDVKQLSPFSDPIYAFDEKRNQWSSALILKNLLSNIPSDAVRVLGVTERDLFIPMLSFVFGHAQVNGSAALISLARLRQEFYKLPQNEELLYNRAMKEAVHELGHTFGLIHCPDLNCAMSLSNSIQFVDKKTEELCKNCSIILEETTKPMRSKIIQRAEIKL